MTAKRELEEETGYRAEQLDFIVSYYTSPGFANEIIYVYKASGLKVVEDQLQGDDDEFVELIEVTLDEAVKLIEEQRIHDAKTIHAVHYLMLQNKG